MQAQNRADHEAAGHHFSTFVYAYAFSAALAQKPGTNYPMSPKIMQAKSVMILCECPRGLAVAEGKALSEL